MWLVILTGHIQYVGPNNVSYLSQNFSQAVGIVHFIDVGNVLVLLLLGFRVINVIDVKAERFGQIVESV